MKTIQQLRDELIKEIQSRFNESEAGIIVYDVERDMVKKTINDSTLDHINLISDTTFDKLYHIASIQGSLPVDVIECHIEGIIENLVYLMRFAYPKKYLTNTEV